MPLCNFHHTLCVSELVNEQFYFINFQTLCVTEDGDYLPAEIAVIEYTLAAGITKTLHRFIQPGKLWCSIHSEFWRHQRKGTSEKRYLTAEQTVSALISWFHIFAIVFWLTLHREQGKYIFKMPMSDKNLRSNTGLRHLSRNKVPFRRW